MNYLRVGQLSDNTVIDELSFNRKKCVCFYCDCGMCCLVDLLMTCQFVKAAWRVWPGHERLMWGHVLRYVCVNDQKWTGKSQINYNESFRSFWLILDVHCKLLFYLLHSWSNPFQNLKWGSNSLYIHCYCTQWMLN